VAVISEVAEGIYRVNAELPGAPLTVSAFVIDDEEPALVETGCAPTRRPSSTWAVTVSVSW